MVINLTSQCDEVTSQEVQFILLTSTIISNLASTIKATTTNLVELQTIITVVEAVVQVPVETLIDQPVNCVEDKVVLPFVAIIGLTSHLKDLNSKINMDRITNIQHSFLHQQPSMIKIGISIVEPLIISQLI